jgi:hypothetical protein
MSESLEHAMEWKKALDAKETTAIDDPVNGVMFRYISLTTSWNAAANNGVGTRKCWL